jgi:AcrR family transcriptional regulator
MTDDRKPYHKPNLEALLLSKAATLIAERGLDKLSLRELGREAGVSRSAPYHYFADKAELLAKVGALGFGRLSAQIESATQGIEKFDARVKAGLGAYAQFALDEPDLFRVMFANVLRRHLATSVVADGPTIDFSSGAAMQAFGGFVEGILDAQRRGLLRREDPLLIVHTLWAFTHGVAELALGDNLKLPGGSARLLDVGIDAILARFRSDA